ncbi:MAG: urea amidolyase associated protein UAAP1 [Gammaproteobacteria bacterium]
MTLPTIEPGQRLWSERLPGGAHDSFLIRRGNSLRLTALDGGANLSALFIHHDEKTERYNMADTLKAQHTFYLARGCVCYSDMGRILCSITGDTVGWHDAVCGVSDADGIRSKFGSGPYQSHRNEMYRNGRDSMLVELEKWGLGKRDLVTPINFFSKVIVAGDGALRFIPGHSQAGSEVDLRFEMNTLVILSSVPHPLDPNPVYAPKPVMLQAFRGGPPGDDDYCRNVRAENLRGFCNTERYYL